MEVISVFDMLKIGVGPSSSHTLGPWRVIQSWLAELDREVGLRSVERLRVHLYGSLALTGRGHCTDKAISLALLGLDPETIVVEEIGPRLERLAVDRRVPLTSEYEIEFDPGADIVFIDDEQLPFHPNGMKCLAAVGESWRETSYFSVGGGFVIREGESMHAPDRPAPPYPCQTAAELLAHCKREQLCIAEMVWANETTWALREEVERRVLGLWEVMARSVFKGCHTEGTLPGGLNLKRRAAALQRKLLVGDASADLEAWIEAIRSKSADFREVMQWISCFALAVNEENANLGRVVTAPTNGAAGVIPAVLMVALCFGEEPVQPAQIADFLMTAGEIGSLFKKGATISAAMGGCQAEIGVSSAMAAAALAELRGGSVEQALMAAEIAMEHHLGMTCDPIAGLVQVPCIERNSMGAVKAINAAELALASDPSQALVSLDQVIQTMDEVSRDMNSKYKETSQGGLATNISVRVPEC